MCIVDAGEFAEILTEQIVVEGDGNIVSNVRSAVLLYLELTVTIAYSLAASVNNNGLAPVEFIEVNPPLAYLIPTFIVAISSLLFYVF